jgi:hypothetical protein
MYRTQFLLLSLVALSSCRSHSPSAFNSDPKVIRSLALAQRFVAADTSGNLRAVDSLWFPMEGMTYCEFGFDTYAVSSAASISSVALQSDTVLVTVTYQVLGFGHSEDAHRVGSHNLRFAAKRTLETDTLQVAQDSTGRTAFVCDHYRVAPNHISAARWSQDIPRLDSTSLAAWKSVQ